MEATTSIVAFPHRLTLRPPGQASWCEHGDRDGVPTVRQTAGVSPSALLRMAMARTQTWTAPPLAAYRERSRQIARIGDNLNQVARWANTHASALDAVRVMDRLTAVERALRALAPPDGADRGAH